MKNTYPKERIMSQQIKYVPGIKSQNPHLKNDVKLDTREPIKSTNKNKISI